MHFNAYFASSLTVVAPPSGNVKTKPAGRKPAELGLGKLRKQLSNMLEDTGVGRRIRRGCIAKWLLVNSNNFVDIFNSTDLGMGTR